jgi:aspartate racemase
MAKRIGILGGISHESTIEYYRLLQRKHFERKKNYYYPEIVIFSLDFQHFTDFEDAGNREGYIGYIMEGISSLERAGVDFILMAANSPHAVFDDVEKLAQVPMLSIVKVTTEAAKKAGVKKLLLLAVSFTVQSLIYQKTCQELGITVVVPSREEQDEVNRIIFKELTIGVLKRDSKNKLLEIINNHEVDGVILGCTELPLVLRQEDSNKKLFDTVELHIDAAFEYAFSLTSD